MIPAKAGTLFEITYKLDNHGWADAWLTDGKKTIEARVSYLDDALGDFARAARGTLKGLPDTRFQFSQEPGVFEFMLTRDGEQVRLRVFRYDDPPNPKEEGLIMDAESPLREFATMAINCLRHVLDKHGEEDYLKRWQVAPFPMQEYQDLLELRRTIA